jgi:hypothetical protein
LSRYPTDEELKTLTGAIDQALARDSAAPDPGTAAGSPRRRVLEDLAWAILTGMEFLFNH